MATYSLKQISGSTPASQPTATAARVQVMQPQVPVKVETDEEIIERMRYRFSVLDDMTRAVKKGHIRSLIVSGPPGVGKSFGVEKVLGKYQFAADLSDNNIPKKFEIIKGSISPLGLFTKLYEFSGEKNIIVFDDIDSIFHDDTSLNLLKAALDSSKTRRLSWVSDSRLLKAEGIPNSFDFKGGIVFITNLNFNNIRSEKLRPHLQALESRSLYLDLTINNEYEKMLRIKQIVHDGMLDDHNLSADVKQDIVDYIDENKHRLRELSLRTVIKTADIATSFPDRWRSIADITVIR